jgi:plastocyanin
VTVWKLAIGSVATVLLLASCGGSSGDNGGSGCTQQGGATGATADQTVKVVTDPDTIGKYDPASVTIKAGQSVEWDFQDTAVQHSVTEDNSVFDSCLQNAGAKFTVTFAKAGDFKYHCQIHSQMTGDVKVS